MAQYFNGSGLPGERVFAILEFLNEVRQQFGEASFLSRSVALSQHGFQYGRAALVLRFCMNHMRESIAEEMCILLNICDLSCGAHFSNPPGHTPHGSKYGE